MSPFVYIKSCPGYPEFIAFAGAIVGAVMAMLAPSTAMSFISALVITNIFAVLTSASRSDSSQPQSFWPLVQVPLFLIMLWFSSQKAKTAIYFSTAVCGSFLSLVAIDQLSSKSFTALCFFDSPFDRALGVSNMLLVCDRMCLILTSAWFFLSLMGMTSQFLFHYRKTGHGGKGRVKRSSSKGSSLATAASAEGRQLGRNKSGAAASGMYHDYSPIARTISAPVDGQAPVQDGGNRKGKRGGRNDEGTFNYFSPGDLPESMAIFAPAISTAMRDLVLQFGFQKGTSRLSEAQHCT